MSFRFLHAADLHLDSPLRGLSRRGQVAGAFVDASRRALENMVATAIGERVAFVVIAGDIYDGDWRDYSTGQFFVRQMGRLAREGIRVFIIRGNHDAESVITKSLPLPNNVHSFSVRTVESVAIEELRVMLHGRGFANRHVPENVAASYPAAKPGYFNIGILHTSLTGREDHDVYAPCGIDDLRRPGYDYWALGHIHKREIVANDPPIVFPGNLQARHARETGAKGATLVTVTDGRVSQVDEVTLDAARFAHSELDLSGLRDPQEFLSAARRAIHEASGEAGDRPLALRLTLTGETALHSYFGAHAGKLIEDVQALAWEINDSVLIEKVRHSTSLVRQLTGSAVIADFAEVLAEVAADASFQAEIEAVLAELRSKAPEAAFNMLDLSGAGENLAPSAISRAQDLVLANLGGIIVEEREP